MQGELGDPCLVDIQRHLIKHHSQHLLVARRGRLAGALRLVGGQRFGLERA